MYVSCVERTNGVLPTNTAASAAAAAAHSFSYEHTEHGEEGRRLRTARHVVRVGAERASDNGWLARFLVAAEMRTGEGERDRQGLDGEEV